VLQLVDAYIGAYIGESVIIIPQYAIGRWE
jgi:hypothetical protein